MSHDNTASRDLEGGPLPQIESHLPMLRSIFHICLLQGEVGAPGEMGPIGESGIQVITRSTPLKTAALYTQDETLSKLNL